MDITPKDFLIFFSLSLVGLIVVLWVLYELYKEVKRIIDEMPTQTKKIIIAVSVCFGAVLLYSEWQDNQKREQINNSSYSLGGSFDNQNYLEHIALVKIVEVLVLIMMELNSGFKFFN